MKLLYFVLCVTSVLFLHGSYVVVAADLDNNEISDSAEENVNKFTTKEKTTTTKIVSSTKAKHLTTVKNSRENELKCPGKETIRPLFSFPCKVTSDCNFLGKGILCCRRRCLQGTSAPKPEPSHEPILFGMVERVCPKNPIPEIFEIKQCTTDADCAPRICCPEKLFNGTYVNYCRTAEPIWDRVPVARPFIEPIKAIVSYMQCTPPPPPFLDLFPKTCNTPLDCFPNLCCQERGKKYCRPPKRSLLALVADLGQRLIPSDAARKFIERIS